MTKLDFSLSNDDQVHQYCLKCHSETVDRVFRGNRSYNRCRTCKTTLSRSVVIDPEIVWWKDASTLEYWHESVGAVIHTANGRMLLFQRIIYPFSLTIPAGHLNKGESPTHGLSREVQEELGLELNDLDFKLFVEEDVKRDRCRRGADNHRWHLYTILAKSEDLALRLNDEGVEPTWFSLDQTRHQRLTYATRHFIRRYGVNLLS